jgi:predicted DNA repair protein MutK
MIGGAYLCFEGFEKLAHKFLHSKEEDDAHHAELAAAVADPQVDLVALEKEKIKGAIRTDFILSAEIIVIALGTVAEAPFTQQVTVLVAIALAMTVGVYGLVGAIVKMDDAGLYLTQRTGAAMAVPRAIGKVLLAAAPQLMKLLSVLGTVAMFMVGGSIITHGMPFLHHAIENAAASVGPVLAAVTPHVADIVVGVVTGGIVLAGVTIVGKLLRGIKSRA